MNVESDFIAVEIPVVELFVHGVAFVDFHIVLRIPQKEFRADEAVPGSARVDGEERFLVLEEVPEAQGIVRRAVMLDAALQFMSVPAVGGERDRSEEHTSE